MCLSPYPVILGIRPYGSGFRAQCAGNRFGVCAFPVVGLRASGLAVSRRLSKALGLKSDLKPKP